MGASIDAGLVLRLEATTALLLPQLKEAAAEVDEYAGKANRSLDSMREKLLNTLEPARAAQAQYNREVETAKKLLDAQKISVEQFTAAEKLSADTLQKSIAVLNGHVEAGGHASNSMAILQHVARSTSDSFSAGLPVAMIFGEQIGRLGEAASLAGGSFGKVGAFLGTGWGIALTSAIAVLGPMAVKLLEAHNAAKELADDLEKAVKSSDSFGNAQSELGKVMDVMTGKFKTHNQVLIETVRLQAEASKLAAQADEKTDSKTLTNAAEPSLKDVLLGNYTNTGRGYNARTSLSPIADAFLVTHDLDAAIAAVDKLTNTQLSAIDKVQFKLKLVKVAADRNDQTAQQQVLDAINGKGVAADLKDGKHAKKEKEYTALDLWVQSFTSFKTYDKWLEETKKEGEASLKATDLARFKIGDVDAKAIIEGSGKFGEHLGEKFSPKDLGVSNQSDIDAALKGGPLAQFEDELSKEGKNINDVFQSIEVDGIKGLTDGIADAITGAKSLGDAFKHVADQIIADLIRIAVRQAIVAPLENLLTGGTSGGAGFLSKLFGGGHAKGGPVNPSQFYMVGEKGPELFVPNTSGQIIPNHRLNMMGGGGQSISVAVDARGATDPAMVEAAAYRAVYATAPMLLAAAQGRTTAALQRPQLASSMG